MKTFLILTSVFLLNLAHATEVQSTISATSFQPNAFMSEHYRLKDVISGITIQNTSVDQTFTITGIFIQQLFQSNCTTSINDNHGELYGASWTYDLTFTPSASLPLGKGYLYNMMMSYLFESAQAGTPGNGSTKAWCIQLGIIQGVGNGTPPPQYPSAPIATITTPSATLSNVVTWTNNSNPAPIAITCDDTTQQCTANASSTQAFPIT